MASRLRCDSSSAVEWVGLAVRHKNLAVTADAPPCASAIDTPSSERRDTGFRCDRGQAAVDAGAEYGRTATSSVVSISVRSSSSRSATSSANHTSPHAAHSSTGTSVTTATRSPRCWTYGRRPGWRSPLSHVWQRIIASAGSRSTTLSGLARTQSQCVLPRGLRQRRSRRGEGPSTVRADELLVGEEADLRLRDDLTGFEQRLELPKGKIDRSQLVERVPPVLVAEALLVRTGRGDVRGLVFRHPASIAVRSRRGGDPGAEGSYAVRSGPRLSLDEPGRDRHRRRAATRRGVGDLMRHSGRGAIRSTPYPGASPCRSSPATSAATPPAHRTPRQYRERRSGTSSRQTPCAARY